MTSPHQFTSVPRERERADGWTAEKQIAFIEALSETGHVSGAARSVGMGTTSAYNLRDEPGAASFAGAWQAAQRASFARLQDIAMDRAINGVAVPHYYKGELVGEERWFDNRMLMFMMGETMTRRYGPRAGEFDLHDAVVRHRHAESKKRAAFVRELHELKADLDRSVEFEQEGEDTNTEAILHNLFECQILVGNRLMELEEEEADAQHEAH